MLKRVAIVGVALLILAMIPGPYFVLKNYCSLEHHGNNKNSHSSGTSEQDASPQREQAQPMAAFNLSVTDPGKIKGSYYAKDKPKQKENWTEKFWCDAKIGEFALVVFTFLLVLSTGGLWFSTHRLWNAAEKQERPWVALDSFNVEVKENTVFFTYAFRNFGKSPTFGLHIDGEFIPSAKTIQDWQKPLRKWREYGRRTAKSKNHEWSNASIIPGGTYEGPFAPGLHNKTTYAAGEATPVLVGCVTYGQIGSSKIFTSGFHVDVHYADGEVTRGPILIIDPT